MRRMHSLLSWMVIVGLLTISLRTFAQQEQLETVRPIPVTKTISVINIRNCNIGVFVGADGVLVIDSGYRSQAVRLQQSIAEHFAKPVRYVLNTHFNYDHVGGNELLAQDGAVIIAHETTRRRMTEEWRIEEILGMKFPVIPPFPAQALPVVCFGDSMTLHLNDDVIQLIHIPGGHTDCDAVVRFREANVIHTGDLFYSQSFPIFEGTVGGYIKAVETLLGYCSDETRVIPGHGPLSDRAGVIAYRDMLVTARDRIDSLLHEGKSLEEIVEMDPISELCPGGKSWLPVKLFIYCAVHGIH